MVFVPVSCEGGKGVGLPETDPSRGKESINPGTYKDKELNLDLGDPPGARLGI